MGSILGFLAFHADLTTLATYCISLFYRFTFALTSEQDALDQSQIDYVTQTLILDLGL